MCLVPACVDVLCWLYYVGCIILDCSCNFGIHVSVMLSSVHLEHAVVSSLRSAVCKEASDLPTDDYSKRNLVVAQQSTCLLERL